MSYLVDPIRFNFKIPTEKSLKKFPNEHKTCLHQISKQEPARKAYKTKIIQIYSNLCKFCSLLEVWTMDVCEERSWTFVCSSITCFLKSNRDLSTSTFLWLFLSRYTCKHYREYLRNSFCNIGINSYEKKTWDQSGIEPRVFQS